MIDTFELGMEATEASRPYAALWRWILQHKLRLEEAGHTVSVEKVTAHQDPDALEPNSLEQQRCLGNGHADTFAKAGARKHAFSESIVDDFKQFRAQNIMVCSAVVRLWSYVMQAGSWVDKDDALLVVSPPEKNSRDAAPPPVAEELVVLQHVLVDKPWGLQCLLCRRWARTDAQKEKLSVLRCVPLLANMAEHNPEGRVHISHSIMQHSSGIIWCDNCGSYADRLLKENLRGLCFPYPSASQAAARRLLRAGKHPRTGAPVVTAPEPGFRSSGFHARQPKLNAASKAAVRPAALDPEYLLGVSPDGTLILPAEQGEIEEVPT